MDADKDIPSEDIAHVNAFVTSTDPAIGYYLPSEKPYIYKVQCEDSQSCNFEKIWTGYEKPEDSLALLVDAGIGMACQEE